MSKSPDNWVEDYGDYLFNYTISRVSDSQLAYDLVQDTFLAALSARDSFEGRSTEKTWLISILKRKIIDDLFQHRDQITLTDFLHCSDNLHLCDFAYRIDVIYPFFFILDIQAALTLPGIGLERGRNQSLLFYYQDLDLQS